jgi:hypothetical protein
MEALFAESFRMQLTAPRPSSNANRVTLVVAIAIFMLALAAAIAFDKPTYAIGLGILATVPALLAVAVRCPLLFPFGLYAIIVPVDPLLKSAGGTGGTLTRYIGILTIAALLYHAFRLRRLNAPPASWLAWAAFMVLCFASWAWSIAPADTQELLGIVASLFTLYTAAAVYPVSARDYVYARRAVVVSGLLVSLYGFYAYETGQRLGPVRLSLSSGNLHIDSNHLAAFFSIPIAIVAARFFCSTSLRERIVCLALIAPMFLNVLLTGSRGGLIAATGLLVYLGIVARKYLLLAGTFALGLIASFAIPNVWERVFDPQLSDASGRDEIWAVGFKAIAHYGVFGAGFGTFADAYDENLVNASQRIFEGWHRPAHNILMQTIVDIGILGVILLLTAWWTTIAQNRSIPRRSPYYPDRIGYEAAMLAIFISALTIDLLWFKYLWLAMMLVVMLTNVVRPRLLVGRRVPQAWTRPAMRRATAQAPARL